MQDPIYDILQTDPTDVVHSLIDRQIKKAERINWYGEWSTFEHRKNPTPSYNEGNLAEFTSSLLKGIKTNKKDGHSICGSIFKQATTRAKKNVSWSILNLNVWKLLPGNFPIIPNCGNTE